MRHDTFSNKMTFLPYNLSNTCIQRRNEVLIKKDEISIKNEFQDNLSGESGQDFGYLTFTPD